MAVALTLNLRHAERTTLAVGDEYDGQDLLRLGLNACFDDVRPEEWTPSHAGRSSRVHFLLKEGQIVIETKLTREGRRDREVADQLAIDLLSCQEHPDCKALVCSIYDPESRVRDPKALEKDLSGPRDVFEVSVLVTPQ